MAWNGSNGASAPAAPAKKPVAPWHGVVALVAIVLFGSAAYFLISQPASKPAKPVANEPEKATIEEVKPEIAEKAVEETKVAAPAKPKKFWKVDASQTNGFTKMQMRKWEIAHRPPPGYTNNAALLRPKARYHIFDHRSENEIAMLLTMSPGQGVIGSPNYRGIEEDFLRSCEHPIVASEDDDDYARELKKLVTETKVELRQRMSEGENLVDILKETREEYRRLAQCKRYIEDEFRKLIKNPETSVADVDDFVTAANMTLESRGVAPLVIGPITRRRLATLKGDYNE